MFIYKYIAGDEIFHINTHLCPLHIYIYINVHILVFEEKNANFEMSVQFRKHAKLVCYSSNKSSRSYI